MFNGFLEQYNDHVTLITFTELFIEVSGALFEVSVVLSGGRVTVMTFRMALVSRILTGEEPCLRKVQYSRTYELPVDPRLIKHKLNHELLVSKVINELNGEIFVNYRVEKEIDDITLVGLIDVLNINSGGKTVIEVKSGKEKESHHVQLWLYMSCIDEAKGILRYPDTRYLYFAENIPENLWEIIIKKLNPLQTTKLLPTVKGYHCGFCMYKYMC